MKKRITDNICSHDFEINQIVKVDRIDGGGTVYFRSGKYVFDNDDCEDFDDYKPGDKIRIKQDTHLHGQTGNLVTITNLTEGYCADGSRSYMTDSGTYIPERDFDCYEGETYVNQKETTTMKYKEGDKVKIVACKRGHGFDIGEVVRITEVNQVNYRAEYLDGHDFWLVGDDEIEPANETTLITRPHDYTGCDPEIAEALKQGLDVYCEVWDDIFSRDENIRDWVYGYVFGGEFPYITKETYYLHARPVRQEPAQEPKTKLVPKPASEIFAWLENPENGYKQTKDGKFWEKENQPTFTEKMVKYCGKDSLAGYDWHSKWLREVPVVEPEPISESSENNPQTATVVEHQAAKLHLGDRVTIIRQDEGGNYLCEWGSGIRIWMQPDQIKFD